MIEKTDYITKTFYKNGKQVGWTELFYKGAFRGVIINGKPHYGHKEGDEFVERIGSDCVCKTQTPEKRVRPAIHSRYDMAGKWTGYLLDTNQVLVKTAHFNSESDACSGKNQVGFAVVQEYLYSVQQGSLHKEERLFGHTNQYGHLIRVSSRPQNERD